MFATLHNRFISCCSIACGLHVRFVPYSDRWSKQSVFGDSVWKDYAFQQVSIRVFQSICDAYWKDVLRATCSLGFLLTGRYFEAITIICDLTGEYA